jgi:hypothetical protein
LTCFNSCFIKRALPCLSTVALLLKCVVIDVVVLSDVQVGDDICEGFFSGHLKLSLTRLERWMQLPNPPWISETY